jgi:hypothetical protein
MRQDIQIFFVVFLSNSSETQELLFKIRSRPVSSIWMPAYSLLIVWPVGATYSQLERASVTKPHTNGIFSDKLIRGSDENLNINNINIWSLYKTKTKSLNICKSSRNFFFTFMWPCIVTNFFVIKPTRCTNFTNLFCHEALRVSDSSSVHDQEFIHCTLSNGICHTSL